ncbi:MAG: hypothetical protein WC919_06170 [Candidatus Paceibacterota bacterium]|jgi:hypothetical protein
MEDNDDSVPLARYDEPTSTSATGVSRAHNSTKRKSIMEQCIDAFYSLEYKMYAFLFLLFIFVTSDVFVNLVLKKMKGTTNAYGVVTPFGVVIQGFALVIAHIIIHALIARGIV